MFDTLFLVCVISVCTVTTVFSLSPSAALLGNFSSVFMHCESFVFYKIYLHIRFKINEEIGLIG